MCSFRYLVASYCSRRRTSIVPRDCWNRLSAFIYRQRQPLQEQQQQKTKNNNSNNTITTVATTVILNKDGNLKTSVVALTPKMAEEIGLRNTKQNSNFEENSDTIISSSGGGGGGGENLNLNNNRLTPFKVHFVPNYFY